MFLRRIACLLVLTFGAIILSGCARDITYKGSYFSKFGGTQMTARATENGSPSVGNPVVFEGQTVRQIGISTNPVPTDARGCVNTLANWPPNVYQINATADLGLGSAQSFPAVLTIVGPFSKGVFAGGVLCADTYLVDKTVRKTTTPREITFGVQHPEALPGPTTTVSPALLLFDNDYPPGNVSITAVDFKVARITADGALVAVKFSGYCFLSKNFDQPKPEFFEATLSNSSPGVWTFRLTVTDFNGCVIYDVPPTIITKGGVIIRPDEL